MLACSRILLVLTLAAAACSRAPELRKYELHGQILAVHPERNEVVIKHEDIKGLMLGMTMPFKVKDPALLSASRPGDLVTGTLVVGEVEAYLSALTKTGHETPAAPPPAETPQVLQEGAPVNDAQLVDQDGTPKPFSSFRGHRVALTFIYTRCPLPEFCPLMDRHFAAVQKEVRGTSALSDVRLVTITFDPEHDTPAVLRTYARRVGADPRIWTFLTGEPGDVASFGSQFGIYVERNPQSAIDITHNLRTAVIGPDGRLVAMHTGNSWTPAELIADLKAAPAPAD